jgi:hypothetical protein
MDGKTVHGPGGTQNHEDLACRAGRCPRHADAVALPAYADEAGPVADGAADGAADGTPITVLATGSDRALDQTGQAITVLPSRRSRRCRAWTSPACSTACRA